MMIWEFDKEGKARLKASKHLPTMKLTTGIDNTKIKMTQYDCNQAHMTLGIMLAPSLQMHQAYATLEEKVNRFSQRLMTSSLNKHKIWKAHISVYIPAIAY